MVKSCTGIIPQRFNEPKQLGDVKAFLNSTGIPGTDKQELLFAWARNVGLKLRKKDYLDVSVTRNG